MKFLEKNLEDIICESDRELLYERGLIIKGILFRQLRIGNYGVADIVTISREPNEDYYAKEMIITRPIITVYELKKDVIGIDAFIQAIGYINGIKSYLEKRGIFSNAIYRMVLIGSDIDNSKACYLPDIIPSNVDDSDFISMMTYDYLLEGILFKDISGYKLTNEGF